MIRKKLGRNPLVDSYPDLIKKAVEFIKLNGYSARARRRNSIGSSGAGVSVDAVRQHLIKTIPGLTYISKTALSYLFCPLTKFRKSSERYKEYIQARVLAKRNHMLKKNIDSHYLFSRVKMRRKFSQTFSDEVIALSCDDMNKLNVGSGMMVSRYHQIRRIYMKDDSPDYEDRS